MNQLTVTMAQYGIYRFRVAAKNDSGIGPYSEESDDVKCIKGKLILARSYDLSC